MEHNEKIIAPTRKDKVSSSFIFAIWLMFCLGLMIYTLPYVKYSGSYSGAVLLLELVMFGLSAYVAYTNLLSVYTSCIEVDEESITFSVDEWKRKFFIKDIKEIRYIRNEFVIYDEKFGHGLCHKREIDKNYWFVITDDGYAEELNRELWFSYVNEDDPYIEKLKSLLADMKSDIKICYYENYDISKLKIKNAGVK